MSGAAGFAGVHGCELAVLVDLSAGTVLASWPDRAAAQERLDGLRLWAGVALGDAGRVAVAAGPVALRVAARAEAGGAEATCLVLHPDADPGAALDAARRGWPR